LLIKAATVPLIIVIGGGAKRFLNGSFFLQVEKGGKILTVLYFPRSKTNRGV
jgi:hypothetical protein